MTVFANAYSPYPHQRDAVNRLHPGAMLVGTTGSGKSYMGLLYYCENHMETTPNLVVITTPMKRDTLDWHGEAARFGISSVPDSPVHFEVESWNNIGKFRDYTDTFFIFDEQRAIGRGPWARSFVKIARRNQWVMLTATPADSWLDLVNVFVALGHFKNRTEFVNNHVVYAPYTKYPKILGYRNEDVLERLRDKVYVLVDYSKSVEAVNVTVHADVFSDRIKILRDTRWNYITDAPIRNNSEFVSLLRRLVNSHPTRVAIVRRVLARHKRVIVFYNFDYELEALRNCVSDTVTIAEHNGHKHEPIPDEDEWLYLVQYSSGNEGWECFTSRCEVMYSLHYSWRTTVQAYGRINRMTTIAPRVWYYTISSHSAIDRAIEEANEKKVVFNENAWVRNDEQ